MNTLANWTLEQSNVAWVENDPRSVHAMLHGKGDGREKMYLAFASKARRYDPNISEENISENFADYVQQNKAKHPGVLQSMRQIYQPSRICQKLRRLWFSRSSHQSEC
ncbi:hypothetical protein ACFQAT_25725 [Undibacterium arcticum]|uniref:Uncharacterized protein n=1 Tax=Undibacterium arcticum TaxID=1762892 RepID=A0ABV7F586_9BURK